MSMPMMKIVRLRGSGMTLALARSCYGRHPIHGYADSNAPRRVRKLIVGLGNPGEQYEGTRHNVGAAAVRHFLQGYVQHALGREVAFKQNAAHHCQIAQFTLSFQPNNDSTAHDSKYPHDDLVDRSSPRRKARTLEEGVPHPLVDVTLMLPTTYMNRSGLAVHSFLHAHHWHLKRTATSLNHLDELMVLSDDVALPFASCRFKPSGGPGGHNGVANIIKCLATPRFARLKIGVGAATWFAAGGTGPPGGTPVDRFVLQRFHPDEQDAMPMLFNYTDELLRVYLHRGLSHAASTATPDAFAAVQREYGAGAT